LIQCALRPPAKDGKGIMGWRGYEEMIRLVNGETVDEVQASEDGAPEQWNRKHTSTTVIFFLGGCTHAEISAIRFMASQDKGQREYVIITTEFLNGDTLLKSFLVNVPKSST